MADGGRGGRGGVLGMEGGRKRGRMMAKATPLLIGIGLFLSACAVEPDYSDYGAPDYAYTDPIYGSLDFDYGGWGGPRRGAGHRFHRRPGGVWPRRLRRHRRGGGGGGARRRRRG